MNTTIHKSFPIYLNYLYSNQINPILNQQITENKFTKTDKEFLNKIHILFNENFSKANYQRFHLANDMAVSEKQLQRKLKALIYKNPMQYLKEFRLKKALSKLKEGYRVSVIGYDCGFSSPSYFSYCFKIYFGVPPKFFQKQTDIVRVTNN